MLLELKRITVPPGQRVLLSDVSWQEFEAILEDLGEHRASRIAYDNGTLEIMTPLPKHEINKELVSDLVNSDLAPGNMDVKTITTCKRNQMFDVE
ncbi:MAG TPA: hypothetical protein V6C85_08325 [Allocoleopsis sp.]